MKTLLAAIIIAAAAFKSRALVVNYNYTLAFTVLTQGPYTSQVGDIYTIAAPVKSSLKTKDILARLAQAEFNLGNYGSSVFPLGSKLICQIDDNHNSQFVVWDANNNFQCDVSDICRIEHPDVDIITSGNGMTGIYNLTGLYQETFVYDDTISGGGLKFKATGNITEKQKRTGSIITANFKSSAQTGAGYNGSQPIILSGTTSGYVNQL